MGAAVLDPAESQRKKQPTGRPFQKGGDPRQSHEMKKVPEVVPERVEVEGVGLLRAMRSVLANHPKRDEGHEEKAARDWMKKDVQRFLVEKEKLEQAEASAKVAEGRSVEVSAKLVELGPDERRVREMIGSILSEMSSC